MKDCYKDILTFVILLIIVLGICWFNAVGTYSNDDWWAALFYSKNIIRNIMDSDQGLVWSWNFEKLITHALPSILHIHPQQNIFVAIVKGIDFAVYVFLLSLFFKPVIKKIPNPLVVLMNALLIFYIVFLYDIQILVQINQHLKYILNLIIGGFIWYIWINEFLNDRFLLKKNIIRDCIFAVVLAFSGHLVNIPTIILFGILFLYEVFKSKNYKENLKNLLPVFIPFTLIYVVCVLVYINLPGFTYIRAVRLPSEPILIYSINHFWDFTRKFFEQIFVTRYTHSLFLITLLGFVGMIYHRNIIDKKYFIITTAILLGNFAFIYSLLTCGTTFYDGRSYWTRSQQITDTFVFYLILNCNIIYGCLYRCIDKTKFKIIFVLSFFVVINLIYPMNLAIKNIKNAYGMEIIQRDVIYKVSKLYRYYSMKSNIIYMPDEYRYKTNIFAWETDFKVVSKNMEIVYNIDLDNKPVKLIKKRIINEPEVFPYKEMNNIDFRKLYDDRFILMMKEPKFGY